MGRPIIVFIFIIVSLFMGGGAAADRVPVFVSIVPQKYFVQQIGQELVDVHIMVQPGASPAIYEPKPRQMAGLSKAKIYYAVGVPFENVWLEKIAAANPKMKVIHTDKGIEKIAMALHIHGGKEGGHGEESLRNDPDEHHAEPAHTQEHHQNTGMDPHIWLSPPLVKIQARAILVSLQEIDPQNGSVYAANFRKLVAQIEQLEADLVETFQGKTGLRFMVFHPAWGYFAHAYGLKQVPIEIEGKKPKPARLKELIQHARKDGIRVIFAQPQFSTKSAELVAREIGGQVVFADPLAEDWMANLREVAVKFQAVLK